MKRSKIVNTAIASTVVIILASGFLSAQQPSGQQEKQSSQKGEMKSMGNMSMDGMMKECSEHHQAITKSLDQTSKKLEGAKQSNDPDKMESCHRSSPKAARGHERPHDHVRQHDEHDAKDAGRNDEGQL